MAYATLVLKGGLVTVVDAQDAHLLAAYRWYGIRSHGLCYVRADIGKNPRRYVHLHRLVARTTDDQKTDHIDGDGLNNRRANLRSCSQKQNIRNKRKNRAPTSSPYKGVCLIKSTGRWRAYIDYEGKRLHLGVFSTGEAAAASYNAAAIQYFGEFARLNIIPESA